MNRTITNEQTDQLFQFCRDHYVNHYDIQVELVDHLASAIEEQWEQNPDLSFHEGLKNSFKKFGIYGFSKIKVQKEKELRRKYNRLLWHFILEYYRWPKVITTFVCTLGLFLLFQVVDQTIWIVLSYAALVFFGVLGYHFFVFKKFKLKIIPGKTFLLSEQFEKVNSANVIASQLPNISYQAFNMMETKTVDNTWILLALSFFMVALAVLLYGQLFYVPQKIKEHFLEQYAEFAL
ncbi:hypothetical protein SLH46_19495 [Draconibacterium sp. IB214405]|uniref:hypothetical protein n=1 Tax=Draconibacterium sp. IB214405 TaxID=3097352 RepID=UPI002A12537A|nr:hypothetical protein [Draconibacterium sp. IB214405]MDX8341392.1 hypothetical protein [Draconibacterium sp. IB214405]